MTFKVWGKFKLKIAIVTSLNKIYYSAIEGVNLSLLRWLMVKNKQNIKIFYLFTAEEEMVLQIDQF